MKGIHLWEQSNLASRNHIARLVGMDEEPEIHIPIMPFGRYKGMPVDEVSSHHLLAMYKHGYLDIHPEVSDWVLKNLISREELS